MVDKFYILDKRKNLNQVYEEILERSINDVLKDIESIENRTSIIIVYDKIHSNIYKLNEDIFNELYKKKIRLNKFWITEETLDKLDRTSVNTIYTQQVVKYKFYTKVFKKDDYIFVIGTTLSDIDEIIGIINKFIVIMCIFSIIVNWILVQFNIGMITKHIKNIKSQSMDISHLNFRTQNIKTCDEIEDLSRSINYMSDSLKKAHDEINSQNEKLKELLCNVAHEIKTPISIIRAYAQGIEDGFDNGTYLNIIYDEISKIDGLIENLHMYFKIRQEDIEKMDIDVSEILESLIRKYSLILKENNIKVYLNFDEQEFYIICMNNNHLNILLENLITNGIKYTTNNKIEIYLTREYNMIRFMIINGIENFDIDVDKLWIPFYVKDKSRDKNFSGTGLGLSIIKEILEIYKFKYGINCADNKFKFYIDFYL